jgi:hypothetical protein
MSTPGARAKAKHDAWAREFGMEPLKAGPVSQEDLNTGLAFMLEHVNFRDSMPVQVIRELAPGDKIAIRHGILGWRQGTVVSIRNFIDDDPFNATVLFKDRQGQTCMCFCEYIGQVYRPATGAYSAARQL